MKAEEARKIAKGYLESDERLKLAKDLVDEYHDLIDYTCHIGKFSISPYIPDNIYDLVYKILIEEGYVIEEIGVLVEDYTPVTISWE